MVQVNLLSNGSVSINKVASTKFVRECGALNLKLNFGPNDKDMMLMRLTRNGAERSASTRCETHDYGNITECVRDHGLRISCRFYSRSSCNVSLSKYEGILSYPDSYSNKTERVLFIYYDHIAELNLSTNGISDIGFNSFSNLEYLKELYLDHNRLEQIKAGAFSMLVNLETLSIKSNYLFSLDENVFRCLVKLNKLNLNDNKLSTLPRKLIQNLVNLKNIQLALNMLVTLDSDFFHGLKDLRTINLGDNQLTSLPSKLFYKLQNLRQLFLYNNQLGSLPVEIFQGLHSLTDLILQFNRISSIAYGTFKGLTKLNTLRLRNNLLTEIPTGLFEDQEDANLLAIRGNKLSILDVDAFKGLHKLQYLLLHYNRLTVLASELFHSLSNLTLLRLNSNQLTELDPNLFKCLGKLSFLDISNNSFRHIPVPSHVISHLTIFAISHNPLFKVDQKSLSSMNNKTSLLVSQHEICECYAPQNVDCRAEDNKSPYLTCKRLLSDRFLEIVIWLIGILSLFGNLFVIVWKQRVLHENKVQTLLLTNLAISDFLMGVYMIIIASADIYFGYDFPLQSEKWRSGVTCKLAGTLSILSSEASVFFVTLISIDRCLHISFPLTIKNLNKRFVLKTVTLTWFFALALALVPNILAGKNFNFYDNAHVCIGFPLALLESFTKHKLDPINFKDQRFRFFSSYSVSNGYSTGLYYSTAIFLGLNCICYLVILGCYIEIMRTVRATSTRSGRSLNMNEQIKMTVKVTAIVATDFLCWFPIILLGILVQTRAITLPSSVLEWLVTCVLPINSAVNPFLYTISEVILRYRKKSQEKAIQKLEFENAHQPHVANNLCTSTSTESIL